MGGWGMRCGCGGCLCICGGAGRMVIMCSPTGRLRLRIRRLAIIDLSPAGEQPMVDRELGLVLVFNGVIYN